MGQDALYSLTARVHIIFDEASGHGRDSQPAGQPSKKRPYTMIVSGKYDIVWKARQIREVMDSVLLIQLFREMIITWAGRNDDMAVGFLGAP